MAIDEKALNEFIGKAVSELGVVWSAALVVVGDRLGLYRAMAGAGALTPADVAGRTGTDERLVAEWLANQAAGGYILYDAAGGTFTLPDEHALLLADPNGPVDLGGAFVQAASVLRDVPKVVEAFHSSGALDWGGHDPEFYGASDRFFAHTYRQHLVANWIPALDEVQAKLEKGARVADFGCGYGTSTILLAQAYPKSTFAGSDFHEASIEVAVKRAVEAGVADRVTFEVASATEYSGNGYDLVMVFDALHDMGDPDSVLRHALRSLDVDGTLMIVEPQAGESVADNLNPVGRIFTAGSTLLCTPSALAQEGLALGNQVGEANWKRIITAAGFTRFRRATETPFNRVFEARP